jgi:hypothetical protein
MHSQNSGKHIFLHEQQYEGGNLNSSNVSIELYNGLFIVIVKEGLLV